MQFFVLGREKISSFVRYVFATINNKLTSLGKALSPYAIRACVGSTCGGGRVVTRGSAILFFYLGCHRLAHIKTIRRAQRARTLSVISVYVQS